MANAYDALAFREIFGRTLNRDESGAEQAFIVSPFGPDTGYDQAARITGAVLNQLRAIMAYGEVFYVSKDITELLYHAAMSLRPEHIFHFEADDFPAPNGLIYFDGLMPMPTTATGTQPLRALLWGQMVSRDRPAGEVQGKLVYSVVDTVEKGKRELYGRWNLRHYMPLVYGERYTPDMMATDPWSLQAWERLGPEYAEMDQRLTGEAASLVWRMLYVFSHFIRQELVVRQHHDSAQHDKIMKRERRPPAQFRVVTLRRYATGPSDNQVEVNWTHRWIQRGHWRNQRVGPRRAMVRPVWIMPMIKGPANKPLIVRDTVISVSR